MNNNNNNNNKIHLLIKNDKYTVRLHDTEATNNNTFNSSKINRMATMQDTRLTYCSFYHCPFSIQPYSVPVTQHVSIPNSPGLSTSN